MKSLTTVRVVAALFAVLALLGTTAAVADKSKPADPQTKVVKPADLTGTWAVDKGHTEIGFAVKHFGVSKTRGRFKDFEGTITVDGVKPENSSVTFTAKIDSIDTGDSNRDNHLKSKDFFDAATYPELTFKSTRVQKKGKEYAVTGNLTLHGVSRPVTLTFSPIPPVVGMDKKLRSGLETSTRIDRRDYDLKWNAVVEGSQVVGNEVDINITLEAVKQG